MYSNKLTNKTTRKSQFEISKRVDEFLSVRLHGVVHDESPSPLLMRSGPPL